MTGPGIIAIVPGSRADIELNCWSYIDESETERDYSTPPDISEDNSDSELHILDDTK
jgi:hypothetical protein